MGPVAWIVFGSIAGIACKLFLPGRERFGWAASIVLGIVGVAASSLVRSTFTHWLPIRSNFDVPSLILAAGGALALILLYSRFVSRRGGPKAA